MWGESTEWRDALVLSLIYAWTNRVEQTIQTPVIWDAIALIIYGVIVMTNVDCISMA